MSEITKLYENAGIEKEFEKPAECVKNPYISCDGCMLYDDKKGKCNNRKDYPQFTAEKQIELIKWLIRKYKTISIEHKLNLFYINITDIYTGMVHIEFDETIAGLINNLWQDLTEEEIDR